MTEEAESFVVCQLYRCVSGHLCNRCAGCLIGFTELAALGDEVGLILPDEDGGGFEAVEARGRDGRVGADVTDEHVCANRELRCGEVTVEHVDAVAARTGEYRRDFRSVAEAVQRVFPVVEQDAREDAVDAFVEDVPRDRAALLRADDGGHEVHGRAAEEAARLCPDGRLREQPVELAVDGLEHGGEVDVEPLG